MTHILLFLLFFVMYSASTLGMDLSLMPGVSVKNAFLYLIFTALAIETAVTRRRRLELVPVFAPFVLYVGYACFMWLVALLVVDYSGYSIRASLFTLKSGPIENLMVLLMFFYGPAELRRTLWLLRSMIWLVVVGNAITVLDALDMPDLGLIHERDDGRVGGPIGQANQFAYFMALFMPLVVALYSAESGIRKLLAGAGVLFSALAFLMAVSRGGIVGLIGGALIGAYLLRRVLPVTALIRTGVVVTILIGVVTLMLFTTDYGDLLFNRFSALGGGARVATSGRDHIWARLLERMLQTPSTFVTGFGWHAYENFQNQNLFGFATHSTYLNILFNLGFVGLALFMFGAIAVLRVATIAVLSSEPESRPFLIAFVVGFLGLLVSLIFGNLYTPWLYIWALTGVSLRLAVLQNADSQATIPTHPKNVKLGEVDQRADPTLNEVTVIKRL